MSSLTAFAGTPEFAVPTLAALRESDAQISCVLTQPDRPAGRGRALRASPVKAAAAGLHVVQPAQLSSAEQLGDFGPQPDLLVVVAYGLILPPWMLAWPRLGAVNVHASLLPRWRGAAPIHRAILAGDEQTGVSIMQLDAGLDTGPVYSTATVPIEPGTTVTALHDTLAELGAQTLLRVLPDILSGKAKPLPQPEAGACYAPKIRKSEAVIDWYQPAAAIVRQVCAMTGWPVAESTLSDGRRLRIWEAQAVGPATTASPGAIISSGPEGIVVAAGEAAVAITRLQPPGGRVMDAGAWLAAHSVADVRFIAAT